MPVYTKELQQILNEDFSEEFVSKMKNRVLLSRFKYGAVKDNYASGKIDCIKTLEERLKKYKETGNTEWLIDVANQAMIEFKYPQHEKGHFRVTSAEESPGLRR